MHSIRRQPDHTAAPDAPGAPGAGLISLVGAGPGARDLLTLRAARRLQEADVIFYDRLVDPEVLEMANPEAERVYVGKVVGASAWPQDRICALIVREALRGRRVVRLKSGDPVIFGRATEELEAARAEGIAVEIVPGVTAASAAAAALGRSLTQRGLTDALILVTGTCRPGDPAPDWGRLVRPGCTIAVYMGLARAGSIAAQMIRAGAPSDTRVQVAFDVAKPSELLVDTTLDGLGAAIAATGRTAAAILLISFPKMSAARSLADPPQSGAAQSGVTLSEPPRLMRVGV